jgi:hypothetical protein
MTLTHCSWHWHTVYDTDTLSMTLTHCSWHWHTVHDTDTLSMTPTHCSWHWHTVLRVCQIFHKQPERHVRGYQITCRRFHKQIKCLDNNLEDCSRTDTLWKITCIDVRKRTEYLVLCTEYWVLCTEYWVLSTQQTTSNDAVWTGRLFNKQPRSLPDCVQQTHWQVLYYTGNTLGRAVTLLEWSQEQLLRTPTHKLDMDFCSCLRFSMQKSGEHFKIMHDLLLVIHPEGRGFDSQWGRWDSSLN